MSEEKVSMSQFQALQDDFKKLDASFDERVKKKVWELGKKTTGFLGITNLLVLIGILHYAFYVMPGESLKAAERKIFLEFDRKHKNIEDKYHKQFENVTKLKMKNEEALKKANRIVNASKEEIGTAFNFLEKVTAKDMQVLLNNTHEKSSVDDKIRNLEEKTQNILDGKIQISKIKTERIEIVNNSNKVRIVIGTYEHGAGYLSILDSSKNQRVLLFEEMDGHAGIKLNDRNSLTRASMTTEPKAGKPSIKLIDQQNQTRILSTFNKNGLPYIHLYDQIGKKRVSIFENEGGFAGLQLNDRKGIARVIATTNTKDGNPTIQLRDHKNQNRIVSTINGKGLPEIGLFDEKEKKRVFMYENEGSFAGLQLNDRKGIARVAAFTNTKDGNPTIQLRDHKKQERIVSTIVDNNPLIKFLNNRGQAFATLPEKSTTKIVKKRKFSNDY